jgi:hypothetical protein
MLRISHCLNNRLTDGGKAVSLKHWPRPEELGKFKKFTSSGLEPSIFRLVAYRLNHTLPRVTFIISYKNTVATRTSE